MRKHYYQINVRPVARGFHVDAGCQSLIYRDTPEDVEEMIKDFSEYMRDPKAKQEWYYETFNSGDLHEAPLAVPTPMDRMP